MGLMRVLRAIVAFLLLVAVAFALVVVIGVFTALDSATCAYASVSVCF